MKPRCLITLISLATLAVLPISDASAGPEELANEKCGNCHGDEGVSTDGRVPSIAGFSARAIEDMLESYASGDRIAVRYKPVGGNETDMAEIVKTLNADDKKDLAGFFSRQAFKPHPQTADTAMADEGAKIHDEKCEKCHSDGGANASDDAAILGGQWRDYLEKGFERLTSGERPMPDKMRKRFEKLTEGEKKQLIEYYVSGGGKKTR